MKNFSGKIRRVSAIPTGLRSKFMPAFPTLKRGANNHCAYGAGCGGAHFMAGRAGFLISVPRLTPGAMLLCPLRGLENKASLPLLQPTNSKAKPAPRRARTGSWDYKRQALLLMRLSRRRWLSRRRLRRCGGLSGCTASRRGRGLRSWRGRGLCGLWRWRGVRLSTGAGSAAARRRSTCSGMRLSPLRHGTIAGHHRIRRLRRVGDINQFHVEDEI